MMLTAGELLGWVAGQMGHNDQSMLARVYASRSTSATPDVGNKAVAMFSATKTCDLNCDDTKSIDDISESQTSHKKTVNN